MFSIQLLIRRGLRHWSLRFLILILKYMKLGRINRSLRFRILMNCCLRFSRMMDRKHRYIFQRFLCQFSLRNMSLWNSIKLKVLELWDHMRMIRTTNKLIKTLHLYKLKTYKLNTLVNHMMMRTLVCSNTLITNLNYLNNLVLICDTISPFKAGEH